MKEKLKRLETTRVLLGTIRSGFVFVSEEKVLAVSLFAYSFKIKQKTKIISVALLTTEESLYRLSLT